MFGSTVAQSEGNGLMFSLSRGLVFSTESGKGEYRDATAILAGAMEPKPVGRSNRPFGKPKQQDLRRSRTAPSQFRIPGQDHWLRGQFSLYLGRHTVRADRSAGTARSESFPTLPAPQVPASVMVTLSKQQLSATKIAAFINGALVVQGTDSSFSSGNPGLGFYNEGGTSANNSDFGFTSFRAEELPGN